MPVGGPVPGVSTMPGLTVKLVVLVAVPPGVVTAIGPVEPVAGTVALILVAEVTVNWLAALLKVTLVAPVNPDPVIVTFVPIVPEAGLNELIVGAAARAGDAPTVTTPAPATTASTTARNACPRMRPPPVPGAVRRRPQVNRASPFPR